jgi:hypothetical protein
MFDANRLWFTLKLPFGCRWKWQFRFGMAEWWTGAHKKGAGKQFWGQFDPVSPGGGGHNQHPTSAATTAAAECC